MNIEKIEDGVRHVFKGDVLQFISSREIAISTQNFVLRCNRSGIIVVDLKEGFELLTDEFYTLYIWEKG